jgi:type I restriction enzyme S subunit
MSSIKQGYKQTKVGIIPEDWEVKKLGNLTNIATGKTPLRSNMQFWENGTIHWATTTEVNETYIVSTNEKITHQAIEELKLKILPINTILLAMYGQGKTRGKVALLKIESTINQAFAAIKPNKNYSTNFVFNFLDSMYEKIRDLSHGSNQDNLNLDIIKALHIPIPPLKEQEKIAEILTTWDEAISLHVKLIEEKEQLKIGLMQKLLSGEVRFEGFCDEWEEVRLGEIAEIYQPQTISQTELTNEGFDVYGANGIIGKYYQYNHELEQIAVTCRGNTCGTVNFTKPKSWITGNAMVINLDNSTKAIKTFIYYLFLNTNFTYLISGSGQPQITGNIKNHKLKLPLLPEQQKIAEVLSLADDELNLLKKELEELKQQKKGLMQKLLTGEVRVMA